MLSLPRASRNQQYVHELWDLINTTDEVINVVCMTLMYLLVRATLDFHKNKATKLSIQ